MKKILLLFAMALFSCMAYCQESTNDFQRLNGEYYYNGMRLKSDQVKNYYLTNCPVAYQEYKSGRSMYVSGIVVSSVGLGLMCASIPVIFKHNYGAVIGMASAGAVVALAGGIPLIWVGGHKANAAYDLYNVSCKKKQTAQVSFDATGDGIGLAIHL